MRLGALQKTSLIDYPGKVTAILFTTGCNFRCGYCHNPELVDPDKFPPQLPEEEILSFLKKRKGQLEAVTITGGEPTLHDDLPRFMKKIKSLGYFIKLDTNGTRPDMVKLIIQDKLADYIAMDIKAPLNKYSKIANTKISTDKIQKSISLLLQSAIDYEFRTTIVQSQLTKQDLLAIGQTIQGARLFVMQKFIPTKANDQRFLNETTYDDQELQSWQNELMAYVKNCQIR